LISCGTKLRIIPQYLRTGRDFDTPLREALQFGVESVKAEDLRSWAPRRVRDSVSTRSMLTVLDSAAAKQGERSSGDKRHPCFLESQNGADEGTR